MTHPDPLLDLLLREADLSTTDLAQRLQMDEDELQRRIAELREQGTILGYQAVLDPNKAWPELTVATIEVRLRPERGGGFERIARRIARFDQVRSCFLISGGYDLQVLVEGRDLREVAAFVSERLATIDGVLSTATHFHLKPYKVNGWALFEEDQGERLSVTP